MLLPWNPIRLKCLESKIQGLVAREQSLCSAKLRLTAVRLAGAHLKRVPLHVVFRPILLLVREVRKAITYCDLE